MRNNSLRAGFTLVEAIVVVAILVVGAALFLPALARSRAKSSHISCVNNLKQIGIAYRVWASDNNDLFPSAAPRSQDGWRDFLTNGNAGPFCWTNYTVMQNELGQAPRVVLCPTDVRKAATNFVGRGAPGGDFGNDNVSYFVGVSASDLYPQSIFGGDRNLGPGSTASNDFGFSPANNSGNDVVLQTNLNSRYCWSLKMHSAKNAVGMGNILVGDGSVQQITSARFAELQAAAAVPRLEDLTNSSPQAPQPPVKPNFRLVFP